MVDTADSIPCDRGGTATSDARPEAERLIVACLSQANMLSAQDIAQMGRVVSHHVSVLRGLETLVRNENDRAIPEDLLALLINDRGPLPVCETAVWNVSVQPSGPPSHV